MCMFVCVYMCVCVCVREGEKDRQRLGEFVIMDMSSACISVHNHTCELFMCLLVNSDITSYHHCHYQYHIFFVQHESCKHLKVLYNLHSTQHD